MTNEEAINSLMMCQDLILFDPMTGKTHELWEENKNNQDLYNACDAAIMALFEQAEREKGCSGCEFESTSRKAPYRGACNSCSRFWSDEYIKKLKEV